ncbi:MAG: peptidylprolyl isomerase [Defluviitaleaceae bacterium]|nr:peptidylprolyl isomerase [Defluviitaleaceae bacterium]
MKKRNFSSATKVRTAHRDERIKAKQAVQQEAKRKQMKQIAIGAGVALVVLAAITFGLLSYYGDNIVARINGIPIRASEITATHIATGEQQLRNRNAEIWTQDWERDLREEAVRVVAMPYIFEEFGREIGLEFEPDTPHTTIVHTVTQTIVDDPDLFAEFSGYMVEGMTVADVEAQYAEQEAHAEEMRIIAQEIFERAIAGEDFVELMETYGEDPGMVGNPEGYTFVAHQMVSEFSEMTMSLEIGEIGPPVRSDFGWHIVLRVEPDPDNIMQGIEADEEDLLGAQHILVSTATPESQHRRNLDERMADFEHSIRMSMTNAVGRGFDTRLSQADLVFRSALNRMPVETTATPDIHVGF